MEKLNKHMITYSLIKKAFLLLIISCILTTCSLAQSLQEHGVTLKVVDMPLGDVLHTLELKTDFTFSYLNEELPLKEGITLDVKDESLQKILEIFSGRFSLRFTRINNVITVKKQDELKERENNKNMPEAYGTLRGVVRDSVTSEVLNYANIFIPEINLGASTNAQGFFIIPSIPVEKAYTVIVTYVGYASKSLVVSVKENKITDININLSETAIEKGNIVVTGERVSGMDLTVQKISFREIHNMSFGVETDIMRAIQLQPGVQSAGDISARYYVRGGASNENLVLLNETPLYNPFHALGIFSVIDPDMINSVEFYKGGFNSSYDGRLSSVMDIITKNGNMNNFGVSAALNQLTVKSVLEGPIPNGSFILTGRKSYSNEVFKKFTNNESFPIDFYDASFKINYSNPEFLPISKFTFFGFLSKDKISHNDKMHADYNWSNSNIGINWFIATKNSPVFAEMVLYYSTFSGGEIPYSITDRHIENKVDDITLKTDFNYVSSNRNEFYGGVKINFIKTKLSLSNSNGQLNNTSDEGPEISGYGGFRMLNLTNLKADFGSRFIILKWTDGPSLSLEPRVNLTYSLLPTLNLKAAWGIYQQELVTLSDEDEVHALFEPWILTPKYLNVPASIHYIGGLDYYLTEKLKLNIEAYYKVMQNLVSINDEMYYPTDPQLFNASGKSHGAEISLKYNNSMLDAQLSYAYSWTTKKIRNFEYHPRYDSRNNVEVFINFDLGKNWRTSLNWSYSSGMPFTTMLGYYNKYNPSEILSPFSILTNYAYSPILAGRNLAHLPDYHRLDISLSRKIQLWLMNLDINLNIINVYNRKNFFYFDFKTKERVNMLPFLPSIDIKAEL